ncbi:MAG TPA: hypothetical protein VJ521_12965, partial [Acidobacteriota bacterium]|nr:hypothetical protein [Acidobacteriota bacterium]
MFSERGLAIDTIAQSGTAAPEAYFERGLEFARQNRWSEARTALEEGEKLAPFDKRFPLELAGIAFKVKDLNASKKYLHRALSLDSQDRYGNEFLATVYYLEGNVESALKYWNR